MGGWPMTLRALLLTDVVDSTLLAERVGDARMAEIWVAHDRAVRDLLPRWRGLEIDRTDGFLMLFGDVTDAVGFGADVHAELARVGARFGVPFAARVGIHWGPVILIETSAADRALGAKPLGVEGLAKPLAARVMSLASGGQTLLTADARARLDPSVQAVSHGAWRMKGVSEPIELFELATPGAPLTPPPDSGKVYRVVQKGDLWLPARDVRHNLPAERDAFVGREPDLVGLARCVDEARLVTVLGIGGTGKTRLVTRFAWTWLGDYPGGAWFCDLSEARSVDGICAAVATALDVPLANDDPVARLGHVLAGRGRCLVVLDNFEQVARWAPESLGRWLDRAAEARFVVTTREVLGLPGETTLALSPLPAEAASDLFVARAIQVHRSFSPSEDDRAAISALVHLLDGLPLAIELAAARVRVMAPKVLLQRMSDRFRLLASTGGRHTRQATLRATLDWSWDLLSGDEQAALGQVSVFEGGFTMTAAEEVLSLDALWPVDAVQSLVNKSLLRPLGDDRFDLLVSVQEYAAERLTASGARAETERRHGAWCASLASPRALDHQGSVDELRALGLELDNLVVGCRRATARGDAPTAVATLRATFTVVLLRGPAHVTVELARGVAEATAPGTLERAWADLVLGQALREAGDWEATVEPLERALVTARQIGDAAFEAAVLRSYGAVFLHQRRLGDAREAFERALAIARERGERRHEATVLGNLGNVARAGAQLDEARGLLERALAGLRGVGDLRGESLMRMNLSIVLSELGQIDGAAEALDSALSGARELGDRNVEGVVLENLAVLRRIQGRFDEARAHLERALALMREIGNRQQESSMVAALANVLSVMGRKDEAVTAYHRALAISRDLGSRYLEPSILCNLGGALRDLGRLEEATEATARAISLGRELGNRRMVGWALGQLATLDASAGRLDEALRHVEAGEAIAREGRDPALLAMLLVTRGEVLWRSGDEGRARAALAEAAAVAPAGHAEVAHAIAAARAKIDPEGTRGASSA